MKSKVVNTKTSVLGILVLYLRKESIIALVLLFCSNHNIFGESFNLKNEEPHHCFFKKNSLMVGLGLSQSLHHKANGINTRVYYNVNEKLCFGPELAYRQGGDFKSTDVNLVAHYILDIHHFGFYPLLGASFTTEESHGNKHEGLGFVYGAGVHRNIKHFTLFAEYARINGAVHDEVITAGAMYVFH